MLADKMREVMREAVGRLPEARKASEWQYCEALKEAAEEIRQGAEDRLSELEGGGDGEND